jgi:uncharacterized membrane protein YtjA (UPF0391 family)
MISSPRTLVFGGLATATAGTMTKFGVFLLLPFLLSIFVREAVERELQRRERRGTSLK